MMNTLALLSSCCSLMSNTREAVDLRGGHPRCRLAPRGRPRPCRLVTSMMLLVKTTCVSSTLLLTHTCTTCTGLKVTSEGTYSMEHCNRSTDLKYNAQQTNGFLCLPLGLPHEPNPYLLIPDEHRLIYIYIYIYMYIYIYRY